MLTFILLALLGGPTTFPTPAVHGAAAAPAGDRRLLIEFSGICTFVPTAGGKWTALLPSIKSAATVNNHAMDPHTPYVKFWNTNQATPTGVSPCNEVKASGAVGKKFLICGLKNERLAIRGPIKSPKLVVEKSFLDEVVSLDEIIDNWQASTAYVTNVFATGTGARFDITRGTLSADSNPLILWTFGSAAASRPLARAAVLELNLGPDDPKNPVRLVASDDSGKELWSVTLAFAGNSVIGIAQTTQDEESISDYYSYCPPEAEDHHFLLNYEVVGLDLTTGKAQCTINGVTNQDCPFPVLDTSANSAPAGPMNCTIKGRKTNCHLVRLPE